MGLLKQRIETNASSPIPPIGQMYTFDNIHIPFPKKNLLIEVTNFCNHACVFCYNAKMSRKRRFINDDLAKNVLKQAYDLGAREVGFYATGEPLMNKKVATFIRYSKELGFEYTYLTTNGALLNSDKTKELVEAGIDSVKLSINAGTKNTYKRIHGHDDFDKVIKNLIFFDAYRKENRINVKLFVSCILNKLNVSEKDILNKIVYPYVDDIVFINIVNQTGLMYEETKELQLKKEESIGVKSSITIPCTQPFNAVTISCEGYLTTCCADFQNYLAIADLNEVTLKEAWNSKAYTDFRMRHLKKDVYGTICYNCANNKNEPIYPLEYKYATLLKQDK